MRQLCKRRGALYARVLILAVLVMPHGAAQASEQNKSANPVNACGDSNRPSPAWLSSNRVAASYVPNRLLVATAGTVTADTVPPGQQLCCCDNICSQAPSKCVCTCKIGGDGNRYPDFDCSK